MSTREPEGKEAALRAVGAPADAQAEGVEDHDATHAASGAARGDEVGRRIASTS